MTDYISRLTIPQYQTLQSYGARIVESGSAKPNIQVQMFITLTKNFLLEHEIFKYEDNSSPAEQAKQSAELDRFLLDIKDQDQWNATMDALLIVSSIYLNTVNKASDIRQLLIQVKIYLEMTNEQQKQEFLTGIVSDIQMNKNYPQN
jgi:hypothetical protein